MAFLDRFVAAYPETTEVLLAAEDEKWFLNLCMDLRNGKPVNFVPVINGDLLYWFKKDSLWCSEEVDAIVGRDAQRLCILHGPVAAKYSVKVDEPVCDIMGGIHDGYKEALQKSGAAVVEVDYLGDDMVSEAGLARLGNATVAAQARTHRGWLSAALFSPRSIEPTTFEPSMRERVSRLESHSFIHRR